MRGIRQGERDIGKAGLGVRDTGEGEGGNGVRDMGPWTMGCGWEAADEKRRLKNRRL